MLDPTAAAPLIVVTVADPLGSLHPELTANKNELYAAGIRRHGGTPGLLHVSVPAEERARLLGTMSGLLLSGGADVDPALYGETPKGAADVDPLRDELELAAWGEAERRAVPVLGICRGLQAINVFLGGGLLQDVPSHAGTPYGSGPAQVHELEIDRDTVLGRTLGGEPRSAGAADESRSAGAASDGRGMLALTVNTFHHQAVPESRLAPTVRPAAWSDSEYGRLVEGFEGTGDQWLVAVQCHPERVDSTPGDFERLWAAFVAAARNFAG
jgi:putative glutamine amidotransferase